MKKSIALLLSICTVLSCAPMSAFAAEIDRVPEAQVEQVDVSEDTVSVTSINNTDYWLKNGSYDGGVVYVTPKAGENLKLHLYIRSGGFNISVQDPKTGTVRFIGSMRGVGHHYADLALNTVNRRYAISFVGGGDIDGGIYAEP